MFCGKLRKSLLIHHTACERHVAPSSAV